MNIIASVETSQVRPISYAKRAKLGSCVRLIKLDNKVGLGIVVPNRPNNIKAGRTAHSQFKQMCSKQCDFVVLL